MTLLNYRRDMGRLAVYDVTRHVQIPRIKPDFHHLKQGRQHTSTYVYEYGQNRVVLPPPTKNLPNTYRPSDPDEINRVLMLFVEAAGIHRDAHLKISARRTLCLPDRHIVEYDENNATESIINARGILCVARHNVKGGEDHFKSCNESERYILQPGHFLVFNDSDVKHKTTKVKIDNNESPGWRDVLTIEAFIRNHGA